MKPYVRIKLLSSHPPAKANNEMVHERSYDERHDLSYEKAQKWVSHMRNADGTSGEHWSLDQVKRLLQQKGMELDPVKVWVSMNAMYSDLCKVNERYGMSSPEYYLDAAVAFWLKDVDAVNDKLGTYYECVVKH